MDSLGSLHNRNLSKPSCLADFDIAVYCCADNHVLSRRWISLENVIISQRILTFQNKVLIKTGSETNKKTKSMEWKK